MRHLLSGGIKKIIHQGFGSQLRRNVVSGVICAFVNFMALAVSYPIYLHFLGYETYGIWLVLTTVLSFAQMGNLGITPAVTKLVAEEYGSGDIKGIQSYVSMALIILSTIGAIMLTVILCLKSPIIALFKMIPENESTALCILPYIGLLIIYVFVVQVLNSTLTGLGRMDQANYLRIVSRLAAVVITIGLLVTGIGIESLLIGNVASYIILHIGSVFFIKRTVHMRLLRIRNWDGKRLVKLFRFGGGVFSSSLMVMFLDPFNKLMLSRWAGVTSIPVYEIAYKSSVMLRGLIETGFRAIVPEVSRISVGANNTTRDRISKINHKTIKIIIFIGGPIFGIILATATPILKLWLGDNYLDTFPVVFRIMFIGSFFGLLGSAPYYIIMGLGRVGKFVFIVMVQCGLHVGIILGFIFLRGSLSVISVAIAIMLSMFISLILISMITKRAIADIDKRG
ncbi:MAG: oligosaccharide flippase family protein [Sedimentisphaerales bacterium]|nr:oligosaccharide flippase family protein [Sedimentisphaerales bacterium]